MKKKIFLFAVCLLLVFSIASGTMIIQKFSSGGASTISYRDSSGNTQDSGDDISITLPASTADGDIMIASITDDAGEAVTAPGGWTFIDRGTFGASVSLTTFSKIASSETGPYLFEGTTTTLRNMAGSITTFQKTGGTWDIEANSNATASVTTTITTASVTATNNSMLVCNYANDDNENVDTAPPSMTLSQTQVSSGVAHNTYYESRSSGAVTKTIIYGGLDEELAAIAVVLDLVP